MQPVISPSAHRQVLREQAQHDIFWLVLIVVVMFSLMGWYAHQVDKQHQVFLETLQSQYLDSYEVNLL